MSELEYYNTQGVVDYSLLACEYLIKHKKFGRKRLDRVIGNVYYLDTLEARLIWDLRRELIDKKGICIVLSDEDAKQIEKSMEL